MHNYTNHDEMLDIDEWIKTDVGQYKVVANNEDMKLCENEKQCTWMESKDVCTEENGYLAEISTKKENIGNDEKEITFDHHEQQLTIRTNRTWRTPSPQPTVSGMSQPVMTQVEVTEEYCSRSGAGIDASEDIGRALEVTKFALTRQSAGSFDGCPDCNRQDKNGYPSRMEERKGNLVRCMCN